MRTRKPVRLLIAVVFGVAIFGCSRLSAQFAESIPSNLIVNSDPFSGFSSDDSTTYAAAVDSQGSALWSGRYTMSGNGDAFGTFSYASKVVSYQRPDVLGPCTDGSLTAPSCGFTWGSGTDGVYHGGDYNLFPNAAGLSGEFQKLKYVQVDIHHELATGDLTGGLSDCGVDIGFGTGVGLAGAVASSNNLSLHGHSGSHQDMVKFMHRYAGTAESLVVEAPINEATDSSYTKWGVAVFDSNYNMSENSRPTLSGDYVDFRMSIVFDHVAHTATITTKPLATNKTLSAMQTQTVTWNYTAPHNAASGGENRGGLMFGSGTNPILLADFLSSRASIGFAGNGVTRRCYFSNVLVGTLKEIETVSTPLTF